MEMKYSMLHLTMCNEVFNDLNCTLIITMNNSWGFDRKLNLFEEFLDPNSLSTNINGTMILIFNSRQRTYLLLLRGPHQRSITEVKNKSKSVFLIIFIAFPVGVGVDDWWVWTSTIFDTKLRGTLQVIDDVLCNFLVTFSKILNESWHHIDNKGNVWATMGKIDKATN